jgi:hypothetical protein
MAGVARPAASEAAEERSGPRVRDVRIMLSRTAVDLPGDEAQELLHRLDEASATGAAEAIRNRAPVGALLTDQQKTAVWNVIHDWIAEVGSEGLGHVLRLREALELDLDIGTGDPVSLEQGKSPAHDQELAKALDPDGRTVVLRQKQWDHICSEHPEMARHQRAIMETITHPDDRADDERPGREQFFAQGKGPSGWLRVIIDYSRRPGL